MGRTMGTAEPFCRFSDGSTDGAVVDNVYGTYLHGLFDTGDLTDQLANYLLAKKGMELSDVKAISHAEYKEIQYALLAASVRDALDMNQIYKMMEEWD